MTAGMRPCEKSPINPVIFLQGTSGKDQPAPVSISTAPGHEEVEARKVGDVRPGGIVGVVLPVQRFSRDAHVALTSAIQPLLVACERRARP
jgi:hypothetical protein